MDDEEFDSDYCLLVKVDPPMRAEDAEVQGEEDFNCLEMYMENITDNNIKFFKFNETRSYAIIKFEEPISGVRELQKKSDEKRLLGCYKITLERIPLVDRVLVTGLTSEMLESIDNSKDLADCELVLYFESKKFCPDGGDIKELKALPCHHAATVQFIDHSVVKKLKAHHKLVESGFTVRPLDIFEFVEGPCCSVCHDDKGVEDIAEDTAQASWHSAHEDIEYEDAGSRINETQSGSQSNSDTDEDIDMQQKCPKKNEDTYSHSQNEPSSFTSGKCSSSFKTFTESHNSETTQLLLDKTIRFKRIPGLIPEEYDLIELSSSHFEITGDDRKKTDHIRRVIEDVKGYGEVDLADYTAVAEQLNSPNGRKWITELLDDLKIPAEIKNDKSTLALRAINLELAEEAANTVVSSLLPAKIKCDQNQVSKCSKVFKGKSLEKAYKSGSLVLLGIPMDVIRAVGEIEKLLGRRW